MRYKRPKQKGKTKAIILTVLVHAAVILVLVVSLNLPSGSFRSAPARQSIVNAVAVNPQKVDAELNHIKEMEAQKRERELKQKQELQDMLKKATEAEQQRKQAVAERKLEETKLAKLKQEQEQARKQAQAEKKRRAAQAAREAAARKKAAAAAKKARAAKAAREAAARKRQAQQAQADMQREMEKERLQRLAASELNQYAPIIRQKVTRYWIRPQDITGLKCSLLVSLTPGGEVTHVEVLKSSGNDIFDRSVVAAVYKATPLPLPKNPELAQYFQQIQFDFDPSKG